MILCVLSIMLASYALNAFSRGGGMDFKDGLFWGSDLDRNERLDRGEAKSIFNLGNKQVYNKHDTNRDGYITKPEFYNYINTRAKNE